VLQSFDIARASSPTEGATSVAKTVNASLSFGATPRPPSAPFSRAHQRVTATIAHLDEKAIARGLLNEMTYLYTA